MKFIRVVSHPHPVSTEPDFVKNAYSGLCLEHSEAIPPGNSQRWTQGFYLVPVREFLKKMKEHSKEAYEWLEPRWGELNEAVEDTGHGIQLCFPAECCFECDSETIQ